MTGALANRGAVWQGYMARATRILAVTGLVTAGLMAASAFILWDSDFYATRDRWEHFKQAWFGEWKPTPWCPSSKRGEDCDQDASLARLFEKVDDASFFKDSPIDGTALDITTGISFASGRDVLNGSPKKHWCYVTVGTTDIREHIELATRQGAAPPVFSEIKTLPESTFVQLGISRTALRSLARTHCDFSNWLSSASAGD